MVVSCSFSPLKRKKKLHGNELQAHLFQNFSTLWISLWQCAFYISNHTRNIFIYAQFNNAQQEKIVQSLFPRPKCSMIRKHVLQVCNRFDVVAKEGKMVNQRAFPKWKILTTKRKKSWILCLNLAISKFDFKINFERVNDF